ncbi:hypothetical protein BGZ96_005604, partial [Linnemannia gamsii]
SNLVTHHPEHGDDSTNTPSTVSSSGSKRKRTRSPVKESDLVIDGLELKRRRLAANGYDTTVIDILTRSETEIRKQARYSHIQKAYHTWCQDNELDPFIANPSNRSSTVAAYRAQVLAIFDDKAAFDNNDTFSQFFKILRANETDNSTDFDLDLSPIITHLRSFTSNEDMSTEELTQKLCWLLGMCAFLRPSDIERIDLDNCRVNDDFISLHIISVPHPTISSLRYNPLIRQVKSPELHIGSQRISKHISAVMSHVQVPPGHRLPKARAAGSTHAAKNGVSVDDIVAQGN